MFDSVSASAASGLPASARRADPPPSNQANANAKEARPVGDAANVNVASDTREDFVPARVEQPSASDRVASDRERVVLPPYVLLYEPSSNIASREESSVVPSSPEPAQKAADSSETESRAPANDNSGQSLQDRVRDLYDLPQ